jgi:hypothetical protein
VSPAESAGTVDVTVTTAGGTSATSSADQFTFVAPLAVPSVSSVSPSSGSTAGGTQVTVTGSNLSGATAVDFGSVAAASYKVDSATQITAVSPAESAGTVDVTVTTAGGTSATSSADQFTYVAPARTAPVVSALFPKSGSTSGYALVWVFGKNFTNVTKVTFGGTSALYRVFSPQLLITLAPPAPHAGSVDVLVTTQAGGTSAATPADQFTYQQETCFLFFCFG